MNEISVIIPHNRGGGTLNASLSHINALKDGGYDVNSFVVFNYKRLDSKHISLLHSYLSYLNPKTFLSAIRRFGFNSGNTVIAMHFDSILFCYLVKCVFFPRKKVYAFFHTNIPAYYSSLSGFKKIFFRIFLSFLNCFDGIVFLTKEQAEWFNCKFPKINSEKSVCIPNPYFKKIKYFLNFDLDLNNNEKRSGIVFLGRLSPEKNVDFIVKAFSLYCQLGGGENLFIYGDGRERSSISNLINLLGLQNRVILCGEIIDPVKSICHAKMLVTASKIEGFPIVLLEALDARLNIITSNCSPACYELFDISNLIGTEVFGKNFSILDVPWHDNCALKYAKEMMRLDGNSAIHANEVVNYLMKYDPKVICTQWDKLFK